MADDPDANILDGEFVDLEEEDPDVEDTPDGGAFVKLDSRPKKGDSEFLVNLAEEISEAELDRLATEFVETIGRDKEARAKRDKQYEEGIKRTGLGNDAPGGATFDGASKVVHPVLTEVCVDFSSRAIKELWPPDGPVKSKIVGDVTKESVAKASRKADFMNWQLTVQAQEVRAELEQLLTQLPLGGGQYLKLGWTEDRNRPWAMFVPIDDMYLPFAATNFSSAQRKTHVQYLTRLEYERRIRSDMYRDVDIVAASMTPEMSLAAVANDKVEGREETAYNEDGLREVFEIYTFADLKDDDLADYVAPYIISIDKTSNKVLSIYRNWDEDDASQEELQWIVEFPFIPWRGAYPIGMTHMIGSLSGAITGSLRALLDAAHIANSQTMLKLKGGTRGGQNLMIEPTQVLEIEGGLNVDDIRKLAMPLPFNQPSQTLFELMGFLVDAAKGVVKTTMDDMADAHENTPVGTTLSRIEQGMVVFSAIHGRLHNAMERVLRILHRLDAMYLDDEALTEEAGSLLASRADFDGPMDVVPVSDPNIFSEAQRYGHIQLIAQRAQLNPDLYDRREVEERILATTKVPNASALLLPKHTPTEENAVSENVKATLGRPIVAFPDQDHIAHLKTHLAYMESPALGMSQLMAPTYLPVILGHFKEHIALWYAAEVFRTASDVTDDLSTLLGKTKDKDDKQVLDQLIAEASLNVVGLADGVFGQLHPVIAKAIKVVQELAPPAGMDPAVQVAMEDVKMRGKVGEQKNQIEQAKIADKQAERAAEDQREQMKTAVEAQREQIKDAVEAQRATAESTAEDRRMGAEIAAEDARASEAVAADLEINEEDNATDMKIALLKLADAAEARDHAVENPPPAAKPKGDS